MEIPKKIKEEIWDYCRINDIPNIDEFILKMVSQGFTVEKYGAAPTPREKIIEKVVEKIVEVPVEKIVEVHVEVEKIVEKEVYISDNEEILKLTEKISELDETIINNSKTYSENYKTLEETHKTQLESKDEIITQLTNQLETEKKKAIRRDIYGEG
jgi:hypothetical protein